MITPRLRAALLGAGIPLLPCVCQAPPASGIVSTEDWHAIGAVHARNELAVVPTVDGHCARNRGQQWTVHFDGRSFRVLPDAMSWSWGLGLLSYGWGAERRAAGLAPAVRTDGERIAYRWDDVLTEWYVNDCQGLEHGFTIGSRPATAQGRLTIALTIHGALAAKIAADGCDVTFVHASGSAMVRYAGLAVSDSLGRTLQAGWELLPGGLCLVVDDRVAEYPITIDPVAHQVNLLPSNPTSNALFGSAVAACGDTVVVGSPQEDGLGSDAGAAYVYVRNGSTWSQQAYLKASNAEFGDQFGYSVAISGNTIVVGAPYEDGCATGVNGVQGNNGCMNAGAAYVFVRNGTTWSQQAYLKASNTDPGDEFGSRVAIGDDTIAVGAIHEDSIATGVNGNQANWPYVNLDGGAVYVFARYGANWIQEAYVKASNTGLQDYFGSAVAVHGDTLVASAAGEDSSDTGVNGNQLDDGALGAGAAYVFVRNGTSWSQQAYLKASNTDAGDTFGFSLALFADTIVVGANREDSNAPGVNGNPGNYLGSTTYDAGAAYVFARVGTTWSQEAYLKASNPGGLDLFGGAVSVHGNRIVVGALSEDSNATGVNGPQSNNSAGDSGAAYFFERTGTTWTQQAYLKSSTINAGAWFGTGVAAAGNLLCVGAMLGQYCAVFDAGVANDGCGEAGPLVMGLNPCCTTRGATSSTPAMSCGAASGDVWYFFTAQCTAPHTFDTCSTATGFDTVLEVYGGTCGALTSLGCSDNSCGPLSSVTASLVTGNVYYVRLGGVGGASGLTDIRVATGTGTGSVALTAVSACPTSMTIAVSGRPNIGDTFAIDLAGAAGLGLAGIGFPSPVPIPAPCGCSVVSDGAGGLGSFSFTSRRVKTIPCNPALIGAQIQCQGLDVFPSAGGCNFVGLQFGLTDIWTVTIG